mmetsp:Transcript_5509/g.8216  ORF Transcript_5509/g.8216 Transcript_5509/m.8216 type:complete len:646 (+) Transcript_5509:32-1969(+)
MEGEFKFPVDTYKIKAEQIKSDFKFPFDPYAIQVELMEKVYQALTNCRGGVFESPTGTGKSLSIICSAFAWLRDSKIEKARKDPELYRVRRSSPMSLPVANVPYGVSQEPQLVTEGVRIKNKILYLTRTHSQISQLVQEIKKTAWSESKDCPKVTLLASRSHYCVKQEVKNSKDVDKECYSARNSGECEFYRPHYQLKESILRSVKDIEEVVAEGMGCSECPYYSMKSAIEEAEFIVAPYSSVINPRVRQNLGIDLKNMHLFIDEGHNISGQIESCLSMQLQQSQIKTVKNFLEQAVNSDNREGLIYYASQLLKVTEELLVFSGKEFGPLGVEYFWEVCNLSLTETRKLVDKQKKVINRLRTLKFGIKVSKGLQNLFEFLGSVVNTEIDAKIITEKKGNSRVLHYYLLSPYQAFKKILDSCKSVFLVGGTMTEEHKDLFRHLPDNKKMFASFEHVIPPENLFLSVISKGETETFEFKYQNYTNPQSKLFPELSSLVVELARVVPGGMVCFFPSYKVIGLFRKTFENFHSQVVKTVFFDDGKDTNLLERYKEACGEGALLFTVCRGKLSEGIDFKDNFGRCVIMVGLPYLNPNEPLIKVKKEYLEETNLSHLPLNYGFKSVFFAEDVLEEVKLSISPPELDFELQN